MTGAWGLVIQLLLPIPTLFLILLSIPTPRRVKRTLLMLLDRVLSVKFVQSVKLGYFFLLIAGIAFATSSYKCYQLPPFNAREVDLGGMTKISYLATKWRLERNFWLSAFCFTMWVVLMRFYQMALETENLKDRLNAGRAAASAPPAPASSSAAAVKGSKADIEMSRLPGDKKSD